MPEDVRLRAGNGFFVGNADDAERFVRARLHENGSASFTKPSIHQMFFHGDDGFTFATGFQNSFGVERFDAVHRNDAAIQTTFGQMSGGEQCVNHRFTRRDERDIVAFTERDGLAASNTVSG